MSRARSAENATLHVALVSDSEIVELNHRYLGKSETTDVIAFDLSGSPCVPDEPSVAGEIYVCLDVAVDAARRYNTSVGYEVVLYVAHGMLHLAGHSDHTPSERRRMRTAERQIMKEIGRSFAVERLF